MKTPDKTNVCRILDQKKIPYKEHSYAGSGIISGVEVADYFQADRSRVFKTLVTVAKSGEHYVFMIPSGRTLDLKKAAKAAGEKSIQMIRQDELLPLTGYVHGGCSPIGMKKNFRTFIDETAENFPEIFFSAGKVGFQVETSLENLRKAVRIEKADLCTPEEG